MFPPPSTFPTPFSSLWQLSVMDHPIGAVGSALLSLVKAACEHLGSCPRVPHQLVLSGVTYSPTGAVGPSLLSLIRDTWGLVVVQPGMSLGMGPGRRCQHIWGGQ